MSESYIEESKKAWYRGGGVNPTNEDLILGCLQRIAAAAELSCKDRERLERDYRYMRESRDSYVKRLDSVKRSNAALRGHIKKLTRAAEALAKGEGN